MKGKEQDNNALWYIATAPPKYESLTGPELSRVFRKGIRKYFLCFQTYGSDCFSKRKNSPIREKVFR